MDGTIPDATFLDQSMAVLPSGLAVLAAPSKFAPLDSLRAEQVAAILDTLRGRFDDIVIDMPRALVRWIEPVVERADEFMVVTDISVSSVRHCRRLLDFLTQDNPGLPVEIVVNHQRRPLFRSRMQREAAKALDRKLDHWLPHDPRAATSAADRGQPLSQSAPRSALGRAMAALAKSTRAEFPATVQKIADQEKRQCSANSSAPTSRQDRTSSISGRKSRARSRSRPNRTRRTASFWRGWS
jgi:pilus assembly protein CpaE